MQQTGRFAVQRPYLVHADAHMLAATHDGLRD
jgi:hypothetical protein